MFVTGEWDGLFVLMHRRTETDAIVVTGMKILLHSSAG